MEVKFKDKILLCVDCGEEFVFTVSAQEYFYERGFIEDPKRCKSCYMVLKRSKKRNNHEAPRKQFRENVKQSERVEHVATEDDTLSGS